MVYISLPFATFLQCTTAIVAGVNLILAPETSVAFSKARMLSEDGLCKTFGVSLDWMTS